MRIFTKEKRQFMLDNYKGTFNKDLHKMFTEKFGEGVTLQQIKSFKVNNKLNSGLKGTEGREPPNKGKRCPNQRNSGNFKKGHKPKNTLEVGYEILKPDGYWKVKIAEPNVWKLKHIHVWEQYHGKEQPEDTVIIFKDRNTENFDPENLELITRAELLTMNRHGLIYDNPEATDVGVNVARLINKANSRRKDK